MLAIDGKAIDTNAKYRKKEDQLPADGRRDIDADFGVKSYHGKHKDGTLWEKVKSWFGYKPHLVIDATYELPAAFSLTKASSAEAPEAHKLLGETAEVHPRCPARHYGISCRDQDFCNCTQGKAEIKLEKKLCCHSILREQFKNCLQRKWLFVFIDLTEKFHVVR